MEQQAGDNEEARGGLDLQKLWELIKEQKRQINEKLDSINENSKKQNEVLSENLIKLMNETFDKNKEETNENKKDKSVLLSGKKQQKQRE